jgi:hypothetical protein
MKRFYQIYIDPNTGNKVIFDDESGLVSGSIRLSGSNVYTIEHNFGSTAIICNVYSSDNQLVMPDKIRIVDINTIEITVSTTEQINISIIA